MPFELCSAEQNPARVNGVGGLKPKLIIWVSAGGSKCWPLLSCSCAHCDPSCRAFSLNPTKAPEFEACATSGAGVFDTLKAVAKAVLTELKRGS